MHLGWRVRDERSLRDRAELCLSQGLACTHKMLRNWAARFAPLVADPRRAKGTG